MKMTHTSTALLAVLTLLFTSACSTLPNDDSPEGNTFNINTQKLVVQVATLRYIGEDVEKAARVREIVGGLMSLDMIVAAPIPYLVERAESEIDWSKLKPTEELLVRALLTTAEDALVRKLNAVNPGLTDSELAEVARLDINKLLSWIDEAAFMQLQGTRVENDMLQLNAAPPAASHSVRTVRRQDLIGFIFNLREVAPLSAVQTDQFRKLRALAIATDPVTGIVDDEVYWNLRGEN